MHRRLPCVSSLLCAELRANLAKAEDMCRKVKMAVANVEKNRIKFPHIDDRELGNRKAFVQGLENVSARARRGGLVCMCVCVCVCVFGP